MRIAQVAPLAESVPPALYGGTERVVSYLTEALVEAGHDVTLVASGDSRTSAKLVAACPRALRLGGCRDPLPHHLLMLQAILERADEFDIIHFHTNWIQFPFARAFRLPCVTTLHGRLDLPELVPFAREFDDHPVVSISAAQRRPLPMMRWMATIHHGLPRSAFRCTLRPGAYLAFLGRISPEKRVDRAIEIASRLGLPLRIAAKVDRADAEYFEREIRPLLRRPGVEFLGEIDEARKGPFLGQAAALLFPIDWPEPFGLVMIEAFACGTPVVAFEGGAVSEVVVDGVSGFVVSSMREAVAATRRAMKLDRGAIRRVFEERFSTTRMAREYESVYRRVVMEHELGTQFRRKCPA